MGNNKAPFTFRRAFNQFAERADRFLFSANRNIKGFFNGASKGASQKSTGFVNKLSGNIALRTGMSQRAAKKMLYWTTMLTSLTAIGLRAPSVYQNTKDPEIFDARLWDNDMKTGLLGQYRELNTDHGYLTMVPHQKGTADLEQNSVYMVKTHGAHFRWGWPFYSRDVEKIEKYQFVDTPFPKEIAEMYARDKKFLETHPDGAKIHTGGTRWERPTSSLEDYRERLEFFAPLIADAGAKWSVDTNYMKSQLIQESHARVNAVGPMTRYGRARGAWQLLDMTADRFGVNPYDPVQSTYASAQYTRILLDMFDGDYRKACAAYNWGEGNLQKCINKHGDNWDRHLPGETANYLQEIFGRLNNQVPLDNKVSATVAPPKPNTALAMKI